MTGTGLGGWNVTVIDWLCLLWAQHRMGEVCVSYFLAVNLAKPFVW